MTPMLYTTSRSGFRSGIRSGVSNGYGNLIYAGPYVYYPGNYAHGHVNSEEEGIALLLDQIQIAREEGADGVCLFRYEFLRDNPEFAQALKADPFELYTRPPIKEQVVPTRQNRWEFNDPTLKEGWELYPRRNDYPLSGQWEIHRAAAGTRLVSPLLDLPPDNVTTFEIRAQNDGKAPVTIKFEWLKGYRKNPHTAANSIEYVIPADGRFHILSTRLESVEGWSPGTGDNSSGRDNVSRIHLSIISGNDPDAVLRLDYIRFLWFPNCQKEWLLLGPFPNVDYEYAMNNNHLRTEENISVIDDFNISIGPEPGDAMCGYQWELFNTTRDYIDFKDREIASDFNTMYAFSHLVAENRGNYTTMLGADDGIKVWINGERIFEDNSTVIDANLHIYAIPVRLECGLNTLLVKVAQLTDEFGFYAKIEKEDNASGESGVRFYPVLPGIPAPEPDDHLEGWHAGPDPVIRFDPVEPGDPSPVFGITRYWWKVDSVRAGSINVTELEEVNGSFRIRLKGLSDGEHVFSLRAQDANGRNGSWGTHAFKIDSGTPSYGAPIPDTGMITAAERESGIAGITWTWNVTNLPVSGIRETLVSIGSEAGGSDILSDSLAGAVTSYTFLNISAHQEYIYLTAIPVSGAGVEGPPSGSCEGVLVDVTPPDKVGSPSLVILMSPDERRVDACLLSWVPGRDRNASAGLDHYAIEYTSQNMAGWFLLARVAGEENSYLLSDPASSERFSFRVHAVDGAGNRGPASDEVTIPNLTPKALIFIDRPAAENPAAFETIFVSAERSFDPDGCVTGYFWDFGDGTFSYGPWAYHTFRHPHLYNLTLTVYDDFGGYNRTMTKINVSERKAEPPVTGNITNDTEPESVENTSQPDERSMMEIGLESPASRLLGVIFLIFILLLCGGVYSNIAFRRRERARFGRFISPEPGKPASSTPLGKTGNKRR